MVVVKVEGVVEGEGEEGKVVKVEGYGKGVLGAFREEVISTLCGNPGEKAKVCWWRWWWWW